MKQTIFAAIIVATVLGIGGVWLYASPLAPPAAVPEQPKSRPFPAPVSVPKSSSTSISPEFLNEIQSGTPFHILIPRSLPKDYTLSANVNVMHFDGGVVYSINQAGSPVITVMERSIGDPKVVFFSADQIHNLGSVTSTEIAGEPGYFGVITKHLKPGQVLAVAVFTKHRVDIQLSSLSISDPQILLQFADTMQ